MVNSGVGLMPEAEDMFRIVPLDLKRKMYQVNRMKSATQLSVNDR